MTDQEPKNARRESLDEVDAETVEDLDVDESAEAIEGGYTAVATITTTKTTITLE